MSFPLSAIRMLADRVLIEPDRPPAQTESGLHLPEIGYHPERSGTVVAKGKKVTTAVRVGDYVAFPHDVGQELQINGTPYLVMREREILAVFEGVV